MKQKLSMLAIGLSLVGMISTPVFAASSDQQQVGTSQTKKHKKVSHHKKAQVVATPAATDDSNSLMYLPMDISVPGKSFVSSGPYIGIPLQYSGTNLIINAPSVNQDVALLKVRKGIDSRLESLGIEQTPSTTHLLLSGIVEGQAMVSRGNGQPTSSDINLTSAGLDAYILGPGQWLSSLIAFSYDDNSGTTSGSYASNLRTQNSRVYISQAFVTIGNLAKTPFYGTFGQLTVPFGTYSSNMIATPLTKAMFATKERAIVLGYRPQMDNAPYAAAYIFKGDSHVGVNTSKINNGGINLGYQFVRDTVKGDIGGGVIANVSDSVGMQNIGNSATYFNGFGGTNGTGNETIIHRVPGYDLRALLSVGEHVDLLAEYIFTTKTFSHADLTMKNHGAKPRALDAEAAYSFAAFSHPSSVAVGYGMTQDALALGLPSERYSFVFNTSIWRDTLQSIEFRHEINYAASATASGSGVAAAPSSGRSNDVVTAQFDVYF
ncbi:MAG: LbtU family siderophore porin [Gammaproteobacteria bacterium]|nr:LbtU family siderophore porin [Gammaproteobacteria bacterium]